MLLLWWQLYIIAEFSSLALEMHQLTKRSSRARVKSFLLNLSYPGLNPAGSRTLQLKTGFQFIVQSFLITFYCLI